MVASTDAPWLARADWAEGRIRSSQAAGLTTPWIFAVVAAGLAGGLLAANGMVADPWRTLRGPGGLVLLPFVLLALALLVSALRRTWRAVRSGASVLELSSVPGVVGGVLQGMIHGGPVLREDQGVRLVLRCIVWSWIRHRSHSIGSSACLWEDDQEVSSASTMAGGDGGSAIPVRFEIPADARATVADEPTQDGSCSVHWILEALGEPGSFWRGEYEVPVFRTHRSPPAPPRPTIDQLPRLVGEMLRGDASSERTAGRIARPPSSRIVVRSTGKGLEIAYPRRTAFLVATAWVVLTLPLYVAPVLLRRWWPEAAPSVGPGSALAAGLLLNALPAFVLLLYEPRRVVVGASEIAVTCGWPLFGVTRRFALAEYDGAEADPSSFSVLRKGGGFFRRRFFLATRLESHAESRWLASEVDAAVRRGRSARDTREST